MKEFYISPYTLKSSSPLNAHSDSSVHGYLVKQVSKGVSSYSVLQSWESLGDPPVKELLESLLDQGQQMHPLVKRCLFFLELDAEYRVKEEWVFEGLDLPINHLIATSLDDLDFKLLEQNFEFIKIKAGKDPAADLIFFRSLLAKIHKSIKIRIDFNKTNHIPFLERLTAQEIKRIDFIEDPGSGDLDQIVQTRSKFNIRVASDKRNFPISEVSDQFLNTFDVLVVKPAYEGMGDLSRVQNKPVCFTSNMDHPLGVIQSMYVASQAMKSGMSVIDCGFLTHLLFEEDEYSSQLSIQNKQLLPPRGWGFGFDHLLKERDWKRISDV